MTLFNSANEDNLHKNRDTTLIFDNKTLFNSVVMIKKIKCMNVKFV